MNIDDIKTVAVIGAGDMGHGIAEVALIAGYRVFLRDINQDLAKRLDGLADRFNKEIFRPTEMIKNGDYR